jgi:hypothetical protein
MDVEVQSSKLDPAAGTFLGQDGFVAGRLGADVRTTVEVPDGATLLLGAEQGLPFSVMVTPRPILNAGGLSEVALEVTVVEPSTLEPQPPSATHGDDDSSDQGTQATPASLVTDHLQLTALSGRSASLTVGGAQPIPQAGGGVQLVPFGTQLQFLPIVLGNGSIQMNVQVELSKLDPAAGTSLGHDGFVSGRLSQGVQSTIVLPDGATLVLGAEQGLPFQVLVTPHVIITSGPHLVSLDGTVTEPRALAPNPPPKDSRPPKVQVQHFQITSVSGQPASQPLGPTVGGVPLGQIDILPVVLGNGLIFVEIEVKLNTLDPATGSFLGDDHFVGGRPALDVKTAVEQPAGTTLLIGEDQDLPFQVEITPVVDPLNPLRVTLDVVVTTPARS